MKMMILREPPPLTGHQDTAGPHYGYFRPRSLEYLLFLQLVSICLFNENSLLINLVERDLSDLNHVTLFLIVLYLVFSLKDFYKNRLFILLGFVVTVWIVVSFYVYSLGIIESLKGAWAYLSGFVLAACIYNHGLSRDSFRRFMSLFVGLSWLFLLEAFVRFFIFGKYQDDTFLLLGERFGHPVAGLFFLYSIFYYFLLFINEKRKKYILFIMLFYAASAISVIRGVFISSIIIFVFLIFIHYIKKIKSNKIVYLFLSIMYITPVIITFPIYYYNKLPNGFVLRLDMRLGHIVETIKKLYHNDLLMFGLGPYSNLVENGIFVDEIPCQYLTSLLHFGVFGVMSFMLVYFLILHKMSFLSRMKKSPDTYFLLFVLVFLHVLTIGNYYLNIWTYPLSVFMLFTLLGFNIRDNAT